MDALLHKLTRRNIGNEDYGKTSTADIELRTNRVDRTRGRARAGSKKAGENPRKWRGSGRSARPPEKNKPR